MKTILRWAFLCAAFLAFALLHGQAMAQTVPTVQGTSIADPAVPVLVAPAPTGSGFFVLNQDFTLLQHSTVDSSQNKSCNGPGIFSRTIPGPRTLVTDLYNAYFSGADAPGLNTAADAITPEVSCTPVQAFDYTGGVATQSLASNDPQHALYYLVSAFGGTNVDQLLVLTNLNNATVSSTNKFTELTEAALDIGGVYTSVVTDTRSDFGLTAITELKTATSPGNLFIYYPQSGGVYSPETNTVYKILGPGGVPLPAVTSFIIPAQTDGGGDLLVLVNQDGLTSSNISSPPLDTNPFTIIDLGQLRLLFALGPKHNTITLPFVQQIKATTPFYAMLGGAYNPLDHRVYVVVAGGTSTSSVVENVISYDTLNPSTPSEQVVADVSSVPFSLGSYPQLALNAASGTMQILTSNPAMVYTVGIAGAGNTAVQVPASTFPDSNFQPTYIAANSLMGETYIASANGQVDILTRPASAQGGLTLTLTGSDLGYTSQEYDLKPLALWPVYDSSLATAALTITVTPKGGAPVVLATGHVSDVGYPGSSFYAYTFPAAGQYTIVATAAASANYPAVTSPPLNVFVGNTGVYPTATSLSVPATVAASNGGASLNATVTLTGTTYAPTGQVYIQDPSGAQVGNVQLPKGVISNPITIPITINQGVQTLTAVYSGDTQNQSSTSTPQVITVGTIAKVTPTFALTLPGTAVTGASVTGNLKFTSTSTTTPSGTVSIYATLANSTTSNQIATVPAAQAFASAGMNFSFAAPAAGTYSVFAGYGGDTNYTNLISASLPFVVSGVQLQTTTIGIVAPATATPGTAFNMVIGFNVQGAFTTPPTGNIVLTATQASGPAITLGTVTAAQGMAPGGANVPVNLPNAGVYTLNANYAGDSLYSPSSNTATVTLNGFSTTLKVTAGASPIAGTPFAATIALTSTSSTATPTGNVILTAVPATGAPITLGTVTAAQALASGGFQTLVTIPSAGNYTLMAAYAGDTNFSSSTGTLAVTVSGPALTATTLGVSAPSTALVGTTFTVTATLKVTGTSTATVTGNVTVIATDSSPTGHSYVLGTMTAAQTLLSGGAQFTGSIPTPGTYTVSAVYPGDANFAQSSGSVVLIVALSTTTTGLSGSTSQVPGVAFPLTVRLASQAGATGTPAGNVVLTSTPVGGGTTTTLFTVTAAQALISGGYQVQVTLPAAGSFTVTATYAGNASFSGSSASLVVTATATATLKLRPTTQTPFIVNVPFDLCVDMTSTTTTAIPTGNFTLTAVDPSLNPVSYPPVPATYSTAQAACTNSPQVTQAGTWVFTATYPGDSNYPPLVATLSLNFQLQQTSITFVGAGTAIALSPYQVVTTLVSPNSAPSGNITISATLNGSSTAALTTTIDAVTAARTTTSFLTFPAPGTYTVAASYPGNNNTLPSNATPLVVVVAPAPPTNFTLTLDDPTVNTIAGALTLDVPRNTTTVTLTAMGVGPGPVSLSVSGTYEGAVVFRDAVTKKLITTATPTTTGMKVIVEYDNPAPTAGLQMLDVRQHPVPVSFAGGLLGLALWGLRRSKARRMRGLRILSAVVFFVFAGQMLSGCQPVANSSQVNVTATPITPSTAAPAQSVVLLVAKGG